MVQNKQAGFSILELLIALMLGLVVVAGIVQLFVGNSRTYELVNAQSRLQESARYSFDFITEAARNAGYFGCAPEADFIIKGLSGNWNSIPEYNLSEAVSGFEAVGDGTFLPTNLLTLPRSEGGVNLNVHIAGNGIDSTELETNSDIVMFRSVEQPVARLNQTLQPDGDPVVFTPGGQPAFAVNDVVIVSDCEQAAMIKVTGITAGVDTTTLAHATAAAGNNFDNADTVSTLGGDIIPVTLSALGRSYGISATVGRMQTTIFFIAPSTQANEAGDNINALWRKQGAAAPVELVQGVENMQIFYGVDTTLDGTANVNRYQTIDAVADPNSIVAVRVRLDVSSPDVLAEVGDRLRRTFTKTISIRNAGV
jgi:type IV pilus assembly protein PilW